MKCCRCYQPVPLFRVSQNSPYIKLVAFKKGHVTKALYAGYNCESNNQNR